MKCSVIHFPVCEFKDGIFYKVTGKMVSGDVEELDAALFGANPSAEEETEQSTGGGSSERVCNVVKNHQLVSVGTWDKKAFKGWIKDYVKNVEKKLKEAGKTDEAEEFKKLAMDGVKYLMANIKDFDVYAGEKNGC
uniref:Translationally-controlled tumor protein homolog n=1 Tax=Phallusia mammillata TaxID=59560 RepID=A0A6F9DVK1_9ASCI|nr:translationally-controlled tumor protein homolog [Phallusia mammillata]